MNATIRTYLPNIIHTIATVSGAIQKMDEMTSVIACVSMKAPVRALAELGAAGAVAASPRRLCAVIKSDARNHDLRLNCGASVFTLGGL